MTKAVLLTCLLWISDVSCFSTRVKLGKNDFYELLQLPKTDNAQEIKQAYRNMAKRYHPDANHNNKSDKSDTTTVQFQQVNLAYRILSDPSLKQQYDVAIQSMLPGQDLAITIEVDHEMSSMGGIKWVHMRHNGICESCSGSGTWHGDSCKTCQGVGIAKRTRRMTVDIPPGVQNRNVLFVKGQGVEGSPPGDLYVTVMVGDNDAVDGPDMGWSSFETISYVDATVASDENSFHQRRWHEY